jgi:acyl dehydratase
MPDAAYLTGLIGQRTAETTVVVERGPVTIFAEAVFDEDDVYRDARAAAAAGFDAIPAPPTFPFVMRHWGAFAELQSTGDEPVGGHLGGVQAILDELRKDGGLILHGEQSFRYHRPVVVGDVLVGKGTIVDAYVKESASSTMTFIVEEVAWSDQKSGDPVVSVRFNVIHRL